VYAALPLSATTGVQGNIFRKANAIAETKPLDTVARDDLEQFWPAAKIVRTDDGDYRWRTTLPHDAVAARIADAVAAIDYDKVKPSVREDRRPAYFGAWSIMMDVQDMRDVWS
jgi:hypothetical protein